MNTARELIRIVCPGFSDSMARTWYSTMARCESRWSCWSIDQGSQVINRTTDSQDSSSSGVSQLGAVCSPRTTGLAMPRH